MTTKRKSKQKTCDYKEFLYRQLQDPRLAAGYLTECFNDGTKVFLLAIKDVVEARGGMSTLAKKTYLNREGLYSMLSKNGNPRLSSLALVLDALGMQLQISPKSGGSKAA